MNDLSSPIHPAQPTLESAETYLLFGDRYYSSNNFPLALKNYQRALTVNPEFATAHERIGMIYQQQGNLMEAIASFSRAIQFAPESLDAQLGLGNTYQQMGWTELAIAHFQIALEIAPEKFLAEYHCKLGDSLKDRGRIAEAIASYERAITTSPDKLDGYRALSKIYAQQSDPAAINAIYEKAEAQYPELLTARDYNLLGVTWLQNLSTQLGTESDLEVNPEQTVEKTLEQALNETLDKAIACFEKAIQIEPDYADAHCNLGSAFSRRGQIMDAILAYKEALDIEPNFAQPYFNLGILLNNIDKLDEAIACFQSAIDLVPNWVEAKEHLSKVLARQAAQ